MSALPKADSPRIAVTFALGEFEARQNDSKYTSAEQFIGFLRERGWDVTQLEEDDAYEAEFDSRPARPGDDSDA